MEPEDCDNFWVMVASCSWMGIVQPEQNKKNQLIGFDTIEINPVYSIPANSLILATCSNSYNKKDNSEKKN